MLLQQLVALEVAGPTQALHDLQQADLAETQGCQHGEAGPRGTSVVSVHSPGMSRGPTCSQATTTVALQWKKTLSKHPPGAGASQCQAEN